ncbi:hypothetical protein [Kaarinaea lacus]
MRKIFNYGQIAWPLVIAFSVVLVVACSSSPKSPPSKDESITDWNARVDNLIADPQRAEKIKQLGQQFIELKNSMAKDFAQMNDKAAEFNANYDTTTDEALQFFQQFEQKRSDALAQYRDLIFAMRSEVSAEEWKALVK